MPVVEDVRYPSNSLVSRYVLKKIVAILFFFAVSPWVIAADNTNVPMLTRLVQQFTDAEKEIISALKKNNQTVLQKLIADDFELRFGNMPSSPVPRDAWLKQSLKEAQNYNSPIEQMAVHDFSDNVVVSFRWQSSFIVDVWVKQKEQWVLKVRYVEKIADKASMPPGAVVTPESEVKKMY